MSQSHAITKAEELWFQSRVKNMNDLYWKYIPINFNCHGIY